jgi:hypothetical protein
MVTERLGYDAPKLTQDEATELCVYHLRCAAGLFQLVPDDENESLRKEILRQCSDGLENTDIKPAMLWAASIYAAYEEMKDRD